MSSPVFGHSLSKTIAAYQKEAIGLFFVLISKIIFTVFPESTFLEGFYIVPHDTSHDGLSIMFYITTA